MIGRIDAGLLVLLGVAKEDSEADAQYLMDKLIGLRIFSDTEGKMNRSIIDIGGKLLIVSQFTLLGIQPRDVDLGSIAPLRLNARARCMS